MDTYYLITFFIFGLFFGSFYNVVAYRLPKKMSLITPGSHCPKCKHRLTPLELIPVLSWVFQGGKCKNCHQSIPIFYPLFETFTGILFALTYKVFGLNIHTFIVLIFLSAILISILSDCLYMVIINPMLVFCEVIIFILTIVEKGTSAILPTILDMIISFAIIELIKLFGNFVFKTESMGDGDVCLMILFGLVLGWEVSIFVIVLAAFLALIPASVNLLKTSKHELPFGPFLGASALITLFMKIDVNTILSILGF